LYWIHSNPSKHVLNIAGLFGLDGFECIQYKECIPAANVCVCIVGSDSQPNKPAIFNTCLDGFECIQYKECIRAANECVCIVGSDSQPSKLAMFNLSLAV
jgi:hypothetical protein